MWIGRIGLKDVVESEIPTNLVSTSSVGAVPPKPALAALMAL